MNEQEFRERYTAAQKSVEVGPDLRERTVAYVEAESSASARVNAQDNTSKTPGGLHSSAPRSQAGSLAARRWALPAAACLVAATLVIGGAPAVIGVFNHSSTGIPMSQAAETAGFSVRAYASNGSSMLALGNDGTVVFNRIEPLYGIGDDYTTEGFFTGCLFRVEGEGIERVQMNISSGELYRYTIESFRMGDSPERVKELITHKPLNRGLGTYYGAYDEVIMLPAPVGTNIKHNPDAIMNVGLSKLYGSTIDVSAENDPGIATGETSFGIWTNEGDPNELALRNDPFNALIDQFEGQTLTVSVTFEDGHTATQVIELHVADFRCDEGDPDDPNDTTIIPEMADSHARANGEHVIHSLYGTVLEANHDPFPLPLDNANDRADTVIPAATLDRAEETWPVQTSLNGELADLKPAESDILDASTSATLLYTMLGEQDATTHNLSIGPVSVVRSALSPNGKTPDEFTEVVYGWLDDLPYFNKCTSERYGYTFNDDGSLSDKEYCYLEATLTVTNTTNEPVDLQESDLGRFGMLDDTGRMLAIDTSYFTLDVSVQGDATVDEQDPRYITLLPGGTAQISLLNVLPNRLADNDGLLFFIQSSEKTPLIFSVGDQV